MSYNNNFIYKARQTVYKWWCVVYKPVFKLVHHGYWPNEKNPYVVFPDRDEEKKKLAEQISNDISSNSSNDFEDGIVGIDANINKSTETEISDSASNISNDNSNSISDATTDEEISLSDLDDDAAKRAQEIMDRLAREAAEDEAKKQSEIDIAKAKAEEQAKLASIMNANKVDISGFIEEGRNNQKNLQ